ncbi:MAG: RNA polymerase sigma factor, partial [Deltaproteobacteria bacterium]|nr:RNA polymerase sigma factor [Deltaproteobacteria bacterium]
MPPFDHAKNNGNVTKTASRVTTLVKQAQAGDKGAFEQLANGFYKGIFHMVFYRTRNRMDAEDITQDIFTSAFNNLSKLQNVERFRAWLFRIGINRVRDFYRKKKIRSIFSFSIDKDEIEILDTIDGEPPNAVDNLMKQEFWGHVDWLLKKLSRMEREVFLLRFMDHLTIKEISQVLRRSESAVKTHLY